MLVVVVVVVVLSFDAILLLELHFVYSATKQESKIF